MKPKQVTKRKNTDNSRVEPSGQLQDKSCYGISKVASRLCSEAKLRGARVYNKALKAMALSSTWQEAISLLSALSCCQPAPDLINYTIVADACAKESAWEFALCILPRM